MNITRRHAPLYLAALLSLLTLLVYLPALRNGFIVWDDDAHVYSNIHIHSLNWAFVRWAFTDISQSGFWYPVTWISHALDYALWGLNPAGHHLTSIVLHAVNTFFIVYLIIRVLEVANSSSDLSGTLEGGAAGRPHVMDERSILIAGGVAGVLFGLHPLRVESVAWVSERKDLLCAMFFLLSLMAYLAYAQDRRGTTGRQGTSVLLNRRYVLALAFFVLALSSKPMAVTLPAVLLLLDWYPLNRLRSVQNILPLLVEKAPFVVFSLLESIITVIAQKAAGAMQTLDSLPLLSRLLVACHSLMAYLGKMAVPFHLNPLYVHPGKVSAASPEYLFSAVLVLGITAGCVVAARRQPAWLWLWGSYVITLLPALGIAQVGSQAMADRFTYLPATGPFVLVGLVAARVWEKASSLKQGARLVKGALAAGAVALGVGLSSLTLSQIAVWQNSIEFWNYVLREEPSRFPLAYMNRGVAYHAAGQSERALSDFSTAIALDTAQTTAHLAHTNRAILYLETGQIELALRDIDAAIALRPAYAEAFAWRGRAFAAQGQFERAIEEYTSAIALGPDQADIYTSRGAALQEVGRPDLAIEDYTVALALDATDAPAYTRRGMAYKEMGRFDRALEDYTRAIALRPSEPEAYNNRGVAYKHLGQLDMAIASYTKAIALNPSFPLAYCNRGIVFGMMGYADRAIEDYSKAISLQPDLIKAYLERGDLYRSRGDATLARKDYQKACDLGSPEGCTAVRVR